MESRKVTLTIKNLNLNEVKEILEKIREIEQRHPDEIILTWINGLEDLPAEEMAKVIQKIFPAAPLAS